MPRSSTKPEIDLRRAMHAGGLRFRIHPRDLPGKPDIVLTRAKLAIFVDGCFWHGCSEHGVVPKNNREWWADKLATNRDRDKRKDEALIALGWTPLHFWEHERADSIVRTVVAEWEARTGRA